MGSEGSQSVGGISSCAASSEGGEVTMCWCHLPGLRNDTYTTYSVKPQQQYQTGYLLVNTKIRHECQVRLLVPESNAFPVTIVVFLVVQCIEVEQRWVDLGQEQRMKQRCRCNPITV